MGIEANFGSDDFIMQSNRPSNFINHSITTNNFTFDGGIKLGYQHYFDKEALGIKQAYGISTNLSFGVGTPINGETYMTFIPQDPLDPQNFSYIFKASYLPIRVGLDVNFLWDFLQRGEHTLGLTVGLQYKFSYYKNTKAELGNSDGAISPEVNTSNAYDDIMLHSFVPQIGLHYYYGNHQFNINCKFGIGYSSEITKGDMLKAFLGGDKLAYKMQIINPDYLSLEYSYRF